MENKTQTAGKTAPESIGATEMQNELNNVEFLRLLRKPIGECELKEIDRARKFLAKGLIANGFNTKEEQEMQYELNLTEWEKNLLQNFVGLEMSKMNVVTDYDIEQEKWISLNEKLKELNGGNTQ